MLPGPPPPGPPPPAAAAATGAGGAAAAAAEGGGGGRAARRAALDAELDETWRELQVRRPKVLLTRMLTTLAWVSCGHSFERSTRRGERGEESEESEVMRKPQCCYKAHKRLLVGLQQTSTAPKTVRLTGAPCMTHACVSARPCGRNLAAAAKSEEARVGCEVRRGEERRGEERGGRRRWNLRRERRRSCS